MTRADKKKQSIRCNVIEVSNRRATSISGLLVVASAALMAMSAKMGSIQ